MTTSSSQTYRIHPAIGIARLGDSPTEFSIAAEKPASLPISCDSQGNTRVLSDGTEVVDTKFKDGQGRIKRQAARFQVYVYDDEHPEGRALKIGDDIKGGGNAGKLVNIQWRVHLANKKAAWYEFKGLSGEHGYDDAHLLRNASITDPNARQQLVIDPGPRFVDKDRRRASFDRSGDGVYAPVFPPKGMVPHDIDTLGDLLTDDDHRLLVLGGHGKSGSYNSSPGHPRIDTYANNDGWFDDTSDGPVMARLVMYSDLVEDIRYIDVEYPAWVITGYPRYVPEILDMITLDDVVYDLAVRKFAYRQDVYGVPGTYERQKPISPNDSEALAHWNAGALDWNPDYKPWFYRDVWTILFRPDEMGYLNNVLQLSNYPHNQSQRGNFDVTKLCVPPLVSSRALATLQKGIVEDNQSGVSFENAVFTRLEMFDDAIEQALHRRIVQDDAKAPSVTMAKAADVPVNRFTELRQLRASVRSGAAVPVKSAKLAKAGVPDLAHKQEQKLKEAAAHFANELVPNAEKLEPQAYLAAWKSEGKKDDSCITLLNEKFKAAVAAALKPFVDEAIKRWAGAVAKAGVKSNFFRGVNAKGDDSDLVKVITDTVNAIASDVRTKFSSGQLMDGKFKEAVKAATNDPNRDMRYFLYRLLRRPGEENSFRTAGKPESRMYRLPLMPLLAGDNPTSNELPSKFLRLTDYQLFILRQWAEGKFYNEIDEGWVTDTEIDPFQPYQNWKNLTPRDLDQGVLSNLLGGAFFPGAEVCWIIRNPSIYKEPYRLKADPEFYNFGQTPANNNSNGVSEQDYLGNAEDPLSLKSDFGVGLQPGDLTKYSALPWQADFNECTMQTIDITDELWNKVYPDSENDVLLAQEDKTWDTLWWPAHRPLQTYEVTSFDGKGQPTGYQYLGWTRGVPQTYAGDLKMVTEWARLGFVVRNPYLPAEVLDQASPTVPKYISVERNPDPV